MLLDMPMTEQNDHATPIRRSMALGTAATATLTGEREQPGSFGVYLWRPFVCTLTQQQGIQERWQKLRPWPQSLEPTRCRVARRSMLLLVPDIPLVRAEWHVTIVPNLPATNFFTTVK